MGSEVKFEIQVLREDRWIVEEYSDSETAARAAAKGILARRNCQGVKIVKSRSKPDGSTSETVIHTETREASAPRVTIVAIDEAPFCQKTSDYYRADSRTVMNRILRKYLEQVFLTPTELIHSHKELKKIQDADGLFPAAVDRVATIQMRETNGNPKERGDEIYKAVAQMTAKARKAEELPNLPKLAGNDFDGVLAKVEALVAPDDAAFYGRVILSRDLGEQRDWLGKLDRLVKLTRPEQSPQVLDILDGLYADLVGVPTALQDVLGYQRHLADALCAMVDLSEGRFSPEKSDARDQVVALTPLLAAGQLAETSKSLIDGVMRQLAGGQPLNRSDPENERSAFRQIAMRVCRPDGLKGGADMAVALTRRSVFLQGEGGKLGLRQAVSSVVSVLADAPLSVVYLLHLADSPLGAELTEEITAAFNDLIIEGTMAKWAPKTLNFKERLLRVCNLYTMIGAASALTDELRQRLLTAIDRVLDLYINNTGLIEKLDDPAARLRDRATRLIEFCGARLLPQGSKTLESVRNRIIVILRQPNFDEHFIEGIDDPAAREKQLRAFHMLLVKAGIK